jgi:dTDP-4-dehydrorhamnose 3,5-epimerase
MDVSKTDLDGVLLIKPLTNFEDFRGEYVEIYNRNLYNAAGVTVDFIQEDISVSTHRVLRGIHGDSRTWKLVTCLYGKFYLVVVNNDPDSPQYKKWTSFTLSDKNRLQILIPPKFGNGHLVLSEKCIFHYKQNSEYDRPSQFTILWNDPAYKFWWPIHDPILSRRDQGIE